MVKLLEVFSLLARSNDFVNAMIYSWLDNSWRKGNEVAAALISSISKGQPIPVELIEEASFVYMNAALGSTMTFIGKDISSAVRLSSDTLNYMLHLYGEAYGNAINPLIEGTKKNDQQAGERANGRSFEIEVIDDASSTRTPSLSIDTFNQPSFGLIETDQETGLPTGDYPLKYPWRTDCEFGQRVPFYDADNVRSAGLERGLTTQSSNFARPRAASSATEQPLQFVSLSGLSVSQEIIQAHSGRFAPKRLVVSQPYSPSGSALCSSISQVSKLKTPGSVAQSYTYLPFVPSHTQFNIPYHRGLLGDIQKTMKDNKVELDLNPWPTGGLALTLTITADSPLFPVAVPVAVAVVGYNLFKDWRENRWEKDKEKRHKIFSEKFESLQKDMDVLLNEARNTDMNDVAALEKLHLRSKALMERINKTGKGEDEGLLLKLNKKWESDEGHKVSIEFYKSGTNFLYSSFKQLSALNRTLKNAIDISKMADDISSLQKKSGQYGEGSLEHSLLSNKIYGVFIRQAIDFFKQGDISKGSAALKDAMEYVGNDPQAQFELQKIGFFAGDSEFFKANDFSKFEEKVRKDIEQKKLHLNNLKKTPPEIKCKNDNKRYKDEKSTYEKNLKSKEDEILLQENFLSICLISYAKDQQTQGNFVGAIEKFSSLIAELGGRENQGQLRDEAQFELYRTQGAQSEKEGDQAERNAAYEKALAIKDDMFLRHALYAAYCAEENYEKILEHFPALMEKLSQAENIGQDKPQFMAEIGFQAAIASLQLKCYEETTKICVQIINLGEEANRYDLFKILAEAMHAQNKKTGSFNNESLDSLAPPDKEQVLNYFNLRRTKEIAFSETANKQEKLRALREAKMHATECLKGNRASESLNYSPDKQSKDAGTLTDLILVSAELDIHDPLPCGETRVANYVKEKDYGNVDPKLILALLDQKLNQLLASAKAADSEWSEKSEKSGNTGQQKESENREQALDPEEINRTENFIFNLGTALHSEEIAGERDARLALLALYKNSSRDALNYSKSALASSTLSPEMRQIIVKEVYLPLKAIETAEIIQQSYAQILKPVLVSMLQKLKNNEAGESAVIYQVVEKSIFALDIVHNFDPHLLPYACAKLLDAIGYLDLGVVSEMEKLVFRNFKALATGKADFKQMFSAAGSAVSLFEVFAPNATILGVRPSDYYAYGRSVYDAHHHLKLLLGSSGELFAARAIGGVGFAAIVVNGILSHYEAHWKEEGRLSEWQLYYMARDALSYAPMLLVFVNPLPMVAIGVLGFIGKWFIGQYHNSVESASQHNFQIQLHRLLRDKKLDAALLRCDEQLRKITSTELANQVRLEKIKIRMDQREYALAEQEFSNLNQQTFATAKARKTTPQSQSSSQSALYDKIYAEYPFLKPLSAVFCDKPRVALYRIMAFEHYNKGEFEKAIPYFEVVVHSGFYHDAIFLGLIYEHRYANCDLYKDHAFYYYCWGSLENPVGIYLLASYIGRGKTFLPANSIVVNQLKECAKSGDKNIETYVTTLTNPLAKSPPISDGRPPKKVQAFKNSIVNNEKSVLEILETLSKETTDPRLLNELVAAKRNLVVLHHVAYYLISGLHFRRRPELAWLFFSYTSVHGKAAPLGNLGWMVESGQSCEKDSRQAFALYTLSYLLGNPLGAYRLADHIEGHLFLKPLAERIRQAAIRQNPEVEAIMMDAYLRNADLGIEIAMTYASRMYALKRGISGEAASIERYKKVFSHGFVGLQQLPGLAWFKMAGISSGRYYVRVLSGNNSGLYYYTFRQTKLFRNKLRIDLSKFDKLLDFAKLTSGVVQALTLEAYAAIQRLLLDAPKSRPSPSSDAPTKSGSASQSPAGVETLFAGSAKDAVGPENQNAHRWLNGFFSTTASSSAPASGTKKFGSLRAGNRKTLHTLGDNDCAFHAVFGRWDSKKGQVVCVDAVQRRKAMAHAILKSLESKENSTIYKLSIMGIQALIMDNRAIGKKTQLLLENYNRFLKDQNDAFPRYWHAFEAELKKQAEAIECIKKNHRHPRGAAASLREHFLDALDRNNSELRRIICSHFALKEAFDKYNELTASPYDWSAAVTDEMVGEYSIYVGKPGQHLLQTEIKLMAEVFGITVDYYSGPTAKEVAILNPGQSQTVAVQFNGINHFEQVEKNNSTASQSSVASAATTASQLGGHGLFGATSVAAAAAPLLTGLTGKRPADDSAPMCRIS